MKQKIILIDGNSIANRAFYGIPDLTNSEGTHTNAIYGFLNIILKVFDEENPGYAAVAFDLKAPTFRHKLYHDYKGTRHAMPDELSEQMPILKDLLRAMKIPVLELEGYEADDILGTISRQMQKEDLFVTILTGDRDLLQLATDEILIRIPKTKMSGTTIEDYYASDVKNRYKVSPKEFIDVKALMGDTSDNIPGVPGIGEKTAIALISQYGSIENAFAHIDEVKPPRAQKAFRENYDLAQMSKELCKICLDAPIKLKKEEASLGNIYTEDALKICRKLEFKNLLGRFPDSDTFSEEEVPIFVINYQQDAEKLFADMKGKKISFFIFADEEQFCGIAIAISDSRSYFLPCTEILPKNYLCKKITESLLKSKGVSTIHLKEQLSYIEIPIDAQRLFFDVSIASYLINPISGSYEIENISKSELNQSIPSWAELFAKQSYSEALTKNPNTFYAYASRCVNVLLKAAPVLEEKIESVQMTELFRDIEMPLVFTLYDMESAGIRVQAEELRSYGNELADRIKELEQSIYKQAGEQFNINSPKQLGDILFEKMHLPHGKKTKTGYSTAADVLEKLAPDYPFVADILEYRQLSKLKSTYADGLSNYISEDGRIHGKFLQTVTATGRISSAEPNLQNIPIRMEMGRLIRKVFVPDDGFVFLDADYSQIELRILASLSNDEDLIEAYREARDIHTVTASKVFHVAPEDVTPTLRRNAKAVNFGIIYGISSFGLSQNLSISRKEAQEYIEQYFQNYPQVKNYLDNSVDEAKKNGYVTTMFRRRRPLPELKSSNFSQRSFGERAAMNAPIQGTAADIIKIAMNRVNTKMKSKNMKSRLILQVHDELLVEAAVDEVDEVRELMVSEMQHAADLRVPLVVEIHDGKNWYEAK